MEKGRYNVVFVDWTIFTQREYAEVYEDVPFVGQTIAKMIRNLVTAGARSSQMVVVGDKLAAHVAGFVGKNLQDDIRLGVIVGLDAAQTIYKDVEPSQRLSRGDADYVMVIHTNTEEIGLRDAIGDLDLYFYGGETQPGCDSEIDRSCSHERAFTYFGYSVSRSPFKGIFCEREADLVECKNNSKNSISIAAEPINKQIKGIYYAEVDQEFFDLYGGGQGSINTGIWKSVVGITVFYLMFN